MAEQTFYCGASGDDGYSDGVSSFDNTGIYAWVGNVSGVVYQSFYRFPNITIPKDATITDAYVLWTSYSTQSNITCKQHVSFNDSDDAVAPTDYASFAGKSRTLEQDWTVDKWTGGWTDGVSLTSSIQSMVNRAGWASGNAMMLILTDDSSSGNAFRRVRTFDNLPDSTRLVITWTEAGTTYEDELPIDVGVNVTFQGALAASIEETINESLILTELPSRSFLCSLIDAITVYDESLNGWIVTVDDGIDFVESLASILGIPVDDWLALTDSQTNNWNGREIIADGLQIWDLCGLGQIITPSIDESISFVDGTVYKLTVTILEYLGFSELAAAMLTTRFSVSDTVALADASERMFPVDVSVPIGITDTSSSLAFLCALAESQVGITAVSTALNRIAQSISESVVLVETNTTNGLFYSTVSETIKLAVTVELNGEVWECYVLNTPSFHPSIYSGFNFNSYCVFENRAFAANSVGIYELAGSTDAGVQIRTAAVFSQTDFESANQKRFRKGFLGVTGEQVVMVFEAEDGSRKAYEVNSHGDVMASRDLKSKAWKLTVVDYESLGSIQLIPVVLTR